MFSDQSNAEFTDHINCFKAFIKKNRNMFDLEKIDQARSVPLDVQTLLSDSEFIGGWPTFNSDLFEKPELTLPLLEYCLHEVDVILILEICN